MFYLLNKDLIINLNHVTNIGKYDNQTGYYILCGNEIFDITAIEFDNLRIVLGTNSLLRP